ncbi:TIGR03915 family putative DNA repair protein [Subsaxibacter sp. CAU 1640]|uniref:TIGR03915 family putative DNA repair protein n=1 Tax=Subsaxibacter sp. CAU 1640 TaxID=2933271 RepID=UPI002005E350|nr:TIGR03915 family putative DNA repair protein [Subsaxibacter sp. CAU 1640]MCK7591748.1 TIGR03915 family putative DNA repair protein [Subsaxibacter sp. CAU 1640]
MLEVNALQILSYDGTFEGFLTCVFHVYERRLTHVDIQPSHVAIDSLFDAREEIITDFEKSKRVWTGLKSKTSSNGRLRLMYAFLSEQAGIERHLLEFIRYVFDSKSIVDDDYSHEAVLKVTQVAKSVGREKHRMEAFVRFRLTKDDLYFATIEPDFNVLPLIQKHFKSRYADQKWLIYDLKRKYGIHYDLKNVEMVTMELPADFDPVNTSEDFFAEEELKFQLLWQNYFKSTNIESRKNMKLHVRHVPKRYWKYLSEKR